MAKRTQTNLTLKQKVNIMEFLKDVLKTDQSGTCEYTDEWDDEKVAASFNKQFPCTKANVVGVRKEIYGNLSSVSKVDRQSAIETKIARLERAVHLMLRIMKNARDADKHLAALYEEYQEDYGMLENIPTTARPTL